MNKKTVTKEKLTSGAPTAPNIYTFASLAPSAHTLRAYASDWKHFETWCEQQNRTVLPARAEVVAEFLLSCARMGLKISTIQRRLAAISDNHLRHRHPSPSDAWEVRSTLRRLRKEGSAPAQSKKALSLDDLRRMLHHCADDLSGLRDRAVLLFGFCTALRRSELVQLRVEDISGADEGIVLTIRGTPAARRKLALPFGKHAQTCPVKVLGAWLAQSGIADGPIFRAVNKSGRVSTRALSDRVVADIVKKYCARIGRRPGAFSGYSLRTGFAIAATKAGASQSSIRRQTGHATLEALRRYTGDAAIFQDHALQKLDI